MQVKKFYDNDLKFEPEEDHYIRYKHFVKNI